MPLLLTWTRGMRISGSCSPSLQFHLHTCQSREPDPAMPSQAGEKAWARREEPQVFARHRCLGKSARPPAHLLTRLPHWLRKPHPAGE